MILWQDVVHVCHILAGDLLNHQRPVIRVKEQAFSLIINAERWAASQWHLETSHGLAQALIFSKVLKTRSNFSHFLWKQATIIPYGAFAPNMQYHQWKLRLSNGFSTAILHFWLSVVPGDLQLILANSGQFSSLRRLFVLEPGKNFIFVLNAPFNSIISDHQPTTQLYTPDSPDPQYQTVPLDFERPEGSILWTWNVLGGFPCERKQLGNLTHSKTNMTYFSLNFSSKTFVQLYSPTQTSSLITDLYPDGFFCSFSNASRGQQVTFSLD